MEKTRITGIALNSIPVYLINSKHDFKYSSAKNEIIVDLPLEIANGYIYGLYGFTNEMVELKIHNKKK